MTRDTETLAQLISAQAGKRSGAPLTFDELAERSVDPETGYRPAGSYLWKIAHGESVKINPSLIRAIQAGLGLPIERIQAAAARQYLGWHVVDPGLGGGGEDDEVIRVATRRKSTAPGGGGVGDFVRRSRADDPSDDA